MSPITPRTASQHEALVLRLEALVRQVGPIAMRQPELTVGSDVRALAEDLLHQCRPFIRDLGPLPPAAPSYGGLGAQLSEARARLEAFELRHTAWDASLKCIVWQTMDGPVPVARLHPQPVGLSRTPEESREAAGHRLAIIRLIDSRYDSGYDDALAGKQRDHRARFFNRDGREKSRA